jgi:serine/threonine-protein kinase
MAADIHALNIRRARKLVGETLRDKWQLDALLGVGGMAAVYAATHRNGSRAAVKVLHRGIEDDANTLRRFLREGYVANKVEHPGVPKVLDDDTADDGRVFLVMELLEGESIDKRMERRGALPTDEVLCIAEQVLDVLEAAHAKGIVHRDLKPDNFYVTHDGDVKVLDFGIAHLHELASQGTAATRVGDLMGTLEYMSPEQARAQWDQVDAQSDVWAVGAAMYTMLSGRPVHTAETVTAMLAIASHAVAKPLGEVVPGVHAKVSAIVDRALEFDKAERWPDAHSMRTAVRAAFPAIAGYAIDKAPPLTSGIDDAETVTRLPAPKAQPRPVAKPSEPDMSDEPTAIVDPHGPTALESNTLTKPFVRPAARDWSESMADASSELAPLPEPPPYRAAVAPGTPMPPRGTTWMASALSIPRSAKRAMRMVWFGMAVIVAMLGVALVFLVRAKDAAPLAPTESAAEHNAARPEDGAEPSVEPWEDGAIDADALESAAAVDSAAAMASAAAMDGAAASASASATAPPVSVQAKPVQTGFGALPAPTATASSAGQFLPQLQPSAQP